LLIKKRDNHDEDVAILQRLLECDITAKQRFLIEREIKCIGSGARGEDSSAYYIDFRFRDSRNCAIIHDLRLECRGFVAQIDHLLINRLLDVYVLESKNYYYGVKITPEGEFLVWNGKTFVAIESPIEQNKRHIDLLERVFQLPGFLPTRLGVSIPPTFLSYVMVAPNSRVDRPSKAKFDTSMVIKADGLGAAIDKRIDDTSAVVAISSLAKLVSQETLEAFARKVVRLHRPAKIDYAAKFGINVVGAPVSKEHLEVSAGTDQRPAGTTPISQPHPIDPIKGANASRGDIEKKGTCEKCGAAVDAKVVFFCRMNKKKFDGKILCRSCQKAS
jgi:hypothetical protein